jgi:hypothetical protein
MNELAPGDPSIQQLRTGARWLQRTGSQRSHERSRAQHYAESGGVASSKLYRPLTSS